MVTTTSNPDLSKSLAAESYLKRFIREYLFPYRFLNFGRNTKLSKCIGFIGPRGSCKSLSAAAMAICDYLIPGYQVISNMQIEWGLRLGDYFAGYRSADLDKAEFLNFNIEDRVAIVADEVNIEFSEARRSMTNRNLIFNKILQQLRKRKLNFIYTVQHEMWIDNRLRWQTDVFIKCQDVCLKPGGIYFPYEFGEFASWKIFDMTGIFGLGPYQDTGLPITDDLRLHAKRWWNTYNTDQIQGDEDVQYGAVKAGRPGYIEKYETEWGWLSDLVRNWNDTGISFITNADLHTSLAKAGRPMTVKVRNALRNLGVNWNAYSQGWDIPSFNLERENTHSHNEEKELIQDR